MTFPHTLIALHIYDFVSIFDVPWHLYTCISSWFLSICWWVKTNRFHCCKCLFFMQADLFVFVLLCILTVLSDICIWGWTKHCFIIWYYYLLLYSIIIFKFWIPLYIHILLVFFYRHFLHVLSFHISSWTVLIIVSVVIHTLKIHVMRFSNCPLYCWYRYMKLTNRYMFL